MQLTGAETALDSFTMAWHGDDVDTNERNTMQVNIDTVTKTITTRPTVLQDVQESLDTLTDAAIILAADDNRAWALARDWEMTPTEARAWVQRHIDLDRLTILRMTEQPVPASLAARLEDSTG